MPEADVEGVLHLAAVAISCVLAAFNYHAVEGFFRRWRPKKLWHVFLALLPLLGLAELWLWLLQTPLHGKLCLRDCGAAVEVLEPCKAKLSPTRTYALAGLEHGCACRRDVSNGQEYIPAAAVTGGSGMVLSGGQNVSLPPCWEPDAANLDLASSVEAGCWDEDRGMTPDDLAAKGKVMKCLDRGACSANGTALPVLFLLGDSHVSSWEVAFALAVQDSMTVSMYSQVCGVAGPEVYDAQAYWTLLRYGAFIPESRARHMQECQTVHDHVFDVLKKELIQDDIVALTIGFYKFGGDAGGSSEKTGYVGCAHCSPTATTQRMIDSHMDFLEETAAEFAARGVKLLLIGDLPTTKLDPSRWSSCSDVDQPAYSELRTRMTELATRVSNVYFLDFFDLMCDSNNQVTGNVPGTSVQIYRDEDHLHMYAGFYLWPFVCDFFQQHGLG